MRQCIFCLAGGSSGGDAQGDTFISIEKFVGTAGADVFDGSASLTSFSADGGGGADTMLGGPGNDTLSIGGAAAAVAGFAALEEEQPSMTDGGPGNDILRGGDGNDTLSYESASAGSAPGIRIVLNSDGGVDSGQFDPGTTDAGMDVIGGGYENVTGSNTDDDITGNASDNTLIGLDGGDTIHGGAGNDRILGGNGIDHLFGDDGDDFIDAGFSGEGVTQTAIGGSGADTLVCSGNGAVMYSSSPDAIDVDQTSNVFLGGDAEGDGVTGFSGIVGSNFDDTIKGFSDVDGGGGNDQIYALNQADVVGGRELKGGDGTDTFYFTTFLADDDYTITDYDYASGEKIDLSAIDADPDAPEDQAFVWDSGESSSPGTIGQREDEDGIVLTLNVGDQQVSIYLQDYFNDGEPLPADAFIL